MRLTLSVLRCPPSAVTETRSFDGGEISIGRGADNDWVLPDPERQLSKKHCVLAFHGGGWQLADTSTNGTYVNGASEPLGQGRPVHLNAGDRIRLGDYEMEARVGPAHPAPGQYGGGQFGGDPYGASQFGGSQPSWGGASSWSEDPIGRSAAGGRGRPAGAQPTRDDPFGTDPFAPQAAPPSAFGGAPVGIGPEPGIRLPENFDPLAPEGGPDDGWLHPAQADDSPAINDAFRPAPVVTALPDDWADDLLGPGPGPAAPAPAPRPAPPPPPVARAAPPAPVAAPVVAADPFPAEAFPGEPFADMGFPAAPIGPGEADPFAPQVPRPRPVAAVTVPQPPPAQPIPAPSPPAPPPATGEAALLAALLRGADMEDAATGDPAELMAQAGAMLRAAVAGLRQVLIARSEVKSEFRIDRTMLSARGNNPLKVSVDDDAALATLLGPRRRADMPPGQAVADALRDIRMHELATMSAMQAAIRAVVASFDPVALRQEAGGGLPVQRKARAWEAFEALHAKVTQGLTDDFDSVFGKSFARAYEQAQYEISARESPDR